MNSKTILIYALLLLLLEGCGKYDDEKVLYVCSDHSYGIREGTSVIIKGYKIGEVSEVIYQPPDFLIKLKIDRQVHIPVDSRYALNSIYYYEHGSIEIFPSDSTKYLLDGDTLTEMDSTSTSIEDIIIDKIKNDQKLLERIKNDSIIVY